jgi:exopolysaccharide biosynthesis protein
MRDSGEFHNQKTKTYTFTEPLIFTTLYLTQLMKTKVSPILLFAFVTHLCCAQKDSLTVVSTKWDQQKICKGVVWKHYLFKGNLFNSNQSVNILEITKPKKIHFKIGYEIKDLKITSEFGKQAHAIAALNGTFFDVKNGGSVDFIKINGNVVSTNEMKDNKRSVHQKAALVFTNGKLKITKWNGKDDWESELNEGDVMESGPLLIFDHHTETIDSSSFSITRHPRTAVLTTDSNRVLLITVDGRNENAVGMSLFELSKLMRWLNANDGLNLDGGGSSTLWIYNQPDNGVVNYPCDNKQWDHAGERKVANVVLVGKRKRSRGK